MPQATRAELVRRAERNQTVKLLKPMPEQYWHKHKMLLLTNNGKHYSWICEICNERYKLLKVVMYRLLRVVGHA